MTDEEIRLLVRTAIAKHLGGSPAPLSDESNPRPVPEPPISFSRYAIPRAPDDVMCVIEPAVKCNHCGFCQCHGH
jgi:hypothetical protein